MPPEALGTRRGTHPPGEVRREREGSRRAPSARICVFAKKGGAPRVRRPRRRGRRVRADARLVARIARVKKCVVTPNRRGSEKAHRGASAATHLAAVTPVACMAFGGAPSGVRARAKFATTRSTRETRGVECGECAARPLGDLSRNNEAENREMTWIGKKPPYPSEEKTRDTLPIRKKRRNRISTQSTSSRKRWKKGHLPFSRARQRARPNHDKPRASEIETRRVRFGGFFLVARFDSARARFRRDTRARDAH